LEASLPPNVERARIGAYEMYVLVPDVPAKHDRGGTDREGRRPLGVGRLPQARAAPLLASRRVERAQTRADGHDLVAEHGEVVDVGDRHVGGHGGVEAAWEERRSDHDQVAHRDAARSHGIRYVVDDDTASAVTDETQLLAWRERLALEVANDLVDQRVAGRLR